MIVNKIVKIIFQGLSTYRNQNPLKFTLAVSILRFILLPKGISNGGLKG